MVVQVATLDILTERAHFTPEVARAIGDAMALEISLTSQNLATKSDLSDLRMDMKQEMSQLRVDMKREMTELRADMEVRIANAKTDIQRWTVAVVSANTAAIVSAVYFFLQNMR